MEPKTIDGIGFIAGRWPLAPDLPTLLFIHGSGGSCGIWKDQVRAMSFLVNTVALDLPGHGGSDGPGMDSVKEYAEEVVRFVGRLEVPKVVPCGLSLGGAIVQTLLLDHTGPFHAGVLISTGARLRVLPELMEAIESDYDRFIAMYGELGFSPQADPGRREAVLAEAAACNPEVTAGDFRACNRFDVMNRLRDIDLPVLVVSAAEDRLTPPKYSDYLVRNINGAVRTRVKGAGHLVPVEKPAAVTSAILEFLDSLSGSF